MAAIVKKIIAGYYYLNEEIADPRTVDLPTLNHPIKMLLFLAFYVYFVLDLGQRLMEKRKPLRLKRVILVYDALQVVLCLGLTYKALAVGWWGHYNWICQPMEWEDTPHQREIALTVYQYFLLKVLDLVDTVFFVLRKKNSHISFLHVYHHTGMVVLTWSAAKWLPGGHETLIGVINSVVHIVMYGYYFVSSLYPRYKRNIWWKKHITQMQMVQFFFNMLHSAILVLQPDCDYPKFTVLIVVPQNLFMFLLFWDFYRKTYRKKPVKEE